MSDAAASTAYWARVGGGDAAPPLDVRGDAEAEEDEDETCIDEALLEYAPPPSSVLSSLCRLAWDATSSFVGEVLFAPPSPP